MDTTLNSGGCCMTSGGCRCKSKQKLSTFDWLCDLPETIKDTDLVEVQFKNTRKGYFLNSTKIPLEKGDVVAVESSPGHDIGEVTLVGRLVTLQMKKNHFNPQKTEIKRVYRKAKETDIEKWNEAKAREQETMIKARWFATILSRNFAKLHCAHPTSQCRNGLQKFRTMPNKVSFTATKAKRLFASLV